MLDAPNENQTSGVNCKGSDYRPDKGNLGTTTLLQILPLHPIHSNYLSLAALTKSIPAFFFSATSENPVPKSGRRANAFAYGFPQINNQARKITNQFLIPSKAFPSAASQTKSRLRKTPLPAARGVQDQGLVVQAVLLTILVATIGLGALINRVAASRQAASAGSLAAAARQAAEVGYSEFMAEMNRDSRSYLWVTKFDQWDQISQTDLNTCSVGTMAPPSANPIAGVTSAVNIGTNLSQSTGGSINPLITLTYRIVDYRVPENLSTPPSVPNCSKFGNLFGGTSMITIIGTASRGNNETTSFTLKRTISVSRVAPIFNNPIFSPPANRTAPGATISSTDTRFPNYPTIPTLTNYTVSCQSKAPAGADGTYDIECSGPGLTTSLFRSSKPPPGSSAQFFPYLNSTGTLWSPCTQAANAVQCGISSLTLSNNGGLSITMPVDTSNKPVEFYLSGTLTIDPGSVLTGFSGPVTTDPQSAGNAWKNFRIYGNEGGGCAPRINLHSVAATAPPPTPPSAPWYQTNLQHSFVWLRCGTVANLTNNTLNAAPGLIGWASTVTSTVPVPANISTIAPRFVFEGLGGPYNFNGIFEGNNAIRFQYRGYGFYEQSPNLP